MSKKLNCIMLIDDNDNDNFFHEREIKKTNLSTVVIARNTGFEALDYLKSLNEIQPDLIFLDINMPGMNGWEFLLEYNLLGKEIKNRVIIIILTTSVNPDDIARAKSWRFVSDFITKPLTKEIMENIIDKYFK